MLPEGWTNARLADVADVSSGGTPKTNEPSYWGGSIIWLTPSEVVANQGRRITGSERTLSQKGLRESGARLVPTDTVLVTSRATVGAVAIAGTELAVNQGFAALAAGEQIDPKYLYYWAVFTKPELERQATGSTFPEISRGKVRALSINYPPITEQRQIVAVLEQADRAVETAARHVANAQALSRAAIEVEVTPSHERSNRAASPLEDVATWEKGRTVSLEPFSGSRPYLTAAVCRGGEAKESVVTGSGVEATSGDPLVLWDGASAGTVFIAPVDGVVASTMSVVRPTSAEVSKEWLGLVLMCRAHLLSDTTSGTTVPHVSGRVLAQISVPIPPLAEQQAIVARIEKVEAAVRAAEAHLERLRALRSSLLENLVSGRVRLPMPDATASEAAA